MAATTNINGWNVGGNNNSFDQRGHFYRAFLSGNVSGMVVKQNSTPNMTVLVEHGSALLNKNTISASVAEIKADTSVTVDTANTSNPRIDTVVIYEDTSVAIPTVEANYWQDGAGGRFKIVSLPGTAAASPVALTDASIQTAIGAGKPWARLADITVPANSTTILNSNIADKRKIISTSVSNYGTAGVLTTDESGSVTVKSPKIGVITGTTLSTTGNKSITGVGFKPSMVKFTLLPDGTYTGSGVSDSGTGVMTPTAQFSATVAVGPSSRGRDSSTNSIRLKFNPDSGSSQLEFTRVSMDANGFTINVTNAYSFAVGYEAYP